MAKLSNKKEQPSATINVGALQCTIVFNSTFTDEQITTIKSKLVLTLSETLQTI